MSVTERLPPAIAEFDGAIVLNDWMDMVDRRMYRVLAGHISVHPNQIVTGEDPDGLTRAFHVKTAQGANFAAVLHGSKETVLVFGCQIRAMIERSLDDTPPEMYVVR